MNLDSGVLVTILVIIAGIIIWSIRQEGAIKLNDERGSFVERALAAHKAWTETEIRDLKTKNEAMDNKVIDRLSLIERHLANIEGKLSISFKDEM